MPILNLNKLELEKQEPLILPVDPTNPRGGFDDHLTADWSEVQQMAQPVQSAQKEVIRVERPEVDQRREELKQRAKVKVLWDEYAGSGMKQEPDPDPQFQIRHRLKEYSWLPGEYQYRVDGMWYDDKFNELPDPDSENWEWPSAVSKVPDDPLPVKVSKFFLGDALGDFPRIYQTIAVGDPHQTHQLIGDMIKDGAWWAAFAGGREYLKALKWVGGKVMAPPRFVLRALGEVVPEAVWPNRLLEGVWERIVIPRKGLPELPGALQKMQDLWLRLNPLTGRYVPTPEGRKSLVETFQPAVERLERVKKGKGSLASPFRNAVRQRELVGQTGKELSVALAKMTPQDRLQAYRALKGLPGTGRAGEVVQEILSKGAKQVRPTYFKSFVASLEKQMKNPELFNVKDEALIEYEPVQKVLRATDELLQGKSRDLKAIQKAFKGVIEDPAAPAKVKLLAMDLYNLPYSTVEAVANASRSASRAFLLSGLKRMGAVKTFIPKGERAEDWVVSKATGLKGLYVPRDVELELKAVDEIPRIARKAWGRYFLTPWKVGKVILNPPTHFRNTVSNVILNDWGGLPFYRLDIYRQAAKEMKSKGRYWKEWLKLTGGGGTFGTAEVEQLLSGMRYGANAFEHTLSLFDRVVQPATKLYNAEEQWAKLSKFIWNRKQGMAPQEAALDAMKWTFNYGEITRATAKIRGSIAPFFTWTSKVLPLMAETAVKHPLRFGKWWMMYEALQANSLAQLGVSDDEWGYIQRIVPEYIREGQFLLLPWRDERGRLQFLNLTYMIPGFGDWSDVVKDPSGTLLGSPLIQIAGSLAHNTSYSGAPIWYDWEPADLRLQKMFSYVWRQAMPGHMSGGVDWERIHRTFRDEPDAMTWPQIAAGEMGFRVVPVDPQKAASRAKVVHMIHLQEMGAEMKRELRRAVSSEERRRIIDKYRKIRLRFYQEGG